MNITNLKIGLKGDDMYLSFSLMDEKQQDHTAAIFAQIPPQGPKDSEWKEIHPNIIIRLHRNRIEAKEYNNPAGPYGRSVVLYAITSTLMALEVLAPEESQLLNAAIDSAPCVVSRNKILADNHSQLTQEMDQITKKYFSN